MFTSRRSRALSSFPNGYACKRRMRQAIDFSHVDVCRHLERSGALHSYPTGDDVSPCIRCESSARDAASLPSRADLAIDAGPLARFRAPEQQTRIHARGAEAPVRQTAARIRCPGRTRVGQESASPKPTRSQSFKVLRCRVLRSVDDSQILSAPAFHSRLDQPALVPGDELERLHDHSFTAASVNPATKHGSRHRFRLFRLTIL